MSHTKYPEVELASASVHGSGSSTDHLFKVEVRTTYHSPKVLGAGADAFVIDMAWRTWPVYEGASKFGVNILSFAFRCSVDLARAQDQLAEVTARLATMTNLVTAAADDLSSCRITVGGKTVRIMENRVLRAAHSLCQALIVAGIELPVKAKDSAQLIEALTLGGDQC